MEKITIDFKRVIFILIIDLKILCPNGFPDFKLNIHMEGIKEKLQCLLREITDVLPVSISFSSPSENSKGTSGLRGHRVLG